MHNHSRSLPLWRLKTVFVKGIVIPFFTGGANINTNKLHSSLFCINCFSILSLPCVALTGAPSIPLNSSLQPQMATRCDQLKTSQRIESVTASAIWPCQFAYMLKKHTVFSSVYKALLFGPLPRAVFYETLWYESRKTLVWSEDIHPQNPNRFFTELKLNVQKEQRVSLGK